ncbi:MAG TPA: 7-cyano-7-deazaguanine synthase QueC [bacterium]|nr:7-cyano-7-deazaguanine synthase QueC [bacterium]HNS48043.1 7-cyano-7-deazaguanine synthase QueC [bacterium]
MSGKAVLLLSGGLDSATVLYWARRRRFEIHPLFFDYGQRHLRERRAAVRLARLNGLELRVVRIRFPWGGSSLLEAGRELPDSAPEAIGRSIPSTYVPARNLVFLAHALSGAEALGAGSILIGANSLDYSGYPDCRPEFYRAFNRVARLGTRAGVEGRPVRVVTPLLRLSKSGIIRLGTRLGVPYQFTWSCYAGGRRPCGRCESCRLRARGFAGAGRTDPLLDDGGPD